MDEGIKVIVKDSNEVFLYDLTSINANINSSNLLRLWAQERTQSTGIRYPRVLTVSSNVLRGQPMGHKRFTVLPKFTFDQIQENDSVYILQYYLDERYPCGGRICFAEEECHDTVRRLRNEYHYGYYIRKYSDYIASKRHESHLWLAQHIDWLRVPNMLQFFLGNAKQIRPNTSVLVERVYYMKKKKSIHMLCIPPRP